MGFDHPVSPGERQVHRAFGHQQRLVLLVVVLERQGFPLVDVNDLAQVAVRDREPQLVAPRLVHLHVLEPAYRAGRRAGLAHDSTSNFSISALISSSTSSWLEASEYTRIRGSLPLNRTTPQAPPPRSNLQPPSPRFPSTPPP